jgi:hypothetical protein
MAATAERPRIPGPPGSDLENDQLRRKPVRILLAFGCSRGAHPDATLF